MERIVAEFVETGTVAILRMQHGENRFNPEFINCYNRVLDQVEKTPSVRAVVTVGEGKFYSNGLDLEVLDNFSDAEESAFDVDLHTLTGRMLQFPTVTVAAINGHCYGMGAFWALAHDYRVMRSDRGWFCFPEIFIHVPISKDLMQLARAKLPVSAHVPCILLGKRHTGEEALRAGIAHRMSSSAELMKTALTLARETANHGKEPYNRAMLAELKHDLYSDVCTSIDDVVVACKL